MRLTIEKKTALVIALFTTVAGVITGFIIWPTIRDIRIAERDTYNLRVYLEKKNQQALRARSTRERLPEIKKIVATFERHLFRRGKELEFIGLIETLAADQGVIHRINSTNLDNTATDRIVLSLTITGDYRKVLSFFDHLEALPYFVTVQELKLTASTDPQTRQEQTILDLDISLYANT